MIRCLAHVETPNLGDRVSSPALYFPHLPRPEEILGASVIGDDVIVGGGGWLRHEALHAICLQARKVILWGVGVNVFFGDLVRDVPLRPWDLGGVRDHPLPKSRAPLEWVPCASCLDPAFDRYKEAAPTTPAVAYEHYERALPAAFCGRLPSFRNDAPALAPVLAHLSRGEVVVTNSYHGLYWATLLGRRVVAYSNSDRFLHFPFPAPVIAEHQDWRAVLDRATPHPEALALCRAAQGKFHARVMEELSLTPHPERSSWVRR